MKNWWKELEKWQVVITILTLVCFYFILHTTNNVATTVHFVFIVLAVVILALACVQLVTNSCVFLHAAITFIAMLSVAASFFATTNSFLVVVALITLMTLIAACLAVVVAEEKNNKKFGMFCFLEFLAILLPIFAIMRWQ